MKYTTFPPPATLTKYVRHFWVLEGEACSAHPYIHRAMADGSAELVFHYRGVFDAIDTNNQIVKYFSAGLDAPSRIVKRYKINTNYGIFGIYLYPYAIPHFFSIPASEVTHQSIDLKSLLAEKENGLEEQMTLALNTAERIEIITRFLENQLSKNCKHPPDVFETISGIIHAKGLVEISTLAKLNYLSRRQFERKFKEFSGFSPKVFTKIIRFQNVLKEYHRSPDSLTRIGLEAGYYDQSHFIKEFKEFSGYTPKEYFHKNGEGPHWRKI